MNNLENENIEIKLLLEAIFMKYGYDFRDYSSASIKRRILGRLKDSGLKTVSDLQRSILYEKKNFLNLFRDLSINVTEMFRDNQFYLSLRKKIIPELMLRPHIKIWHAGCSTGEEVYSMAILLKEAGIYKKSQIFATDFDEEAVLKAKEGVYSIKNIQKYTKNYKSSGGLESFGDYYSAKYERAIINSELKENILFSVHNLTADGVFGEMDIILCRNVIIYFNRELQTRVFNLFNNSLSTGSFLCMGLRETISLSNIVDDYEVVDNENKIYKKMN